MPPLGVDYHLRCESPVSVRAWSPERAIWTIQQAALVNHY